MKNISNFEEFNEEISLKKAAAGLALAAGLSMSPNKPVDAEKKYDLTTTNSRISNQSKITFGTVDENSNLFEVTYKSPKSSKVKSIIFESSADDIYKMLDVLKNINNDISIESSTLPFEVDTIPGKDASTIRLPVSVMREIAQDILRKDSLEEENKLLWKNSDILSNQLRLKDVLILNKDSIISLKNYLLAAKDTIITFKDKQFQAQKDLSIKLEKEIKKQKKKTLRSNSLIVIILVLLLLQVR